MTVAEYLDWEPRQEQRCISTLQEYLLISSERVGMDCYRRGEGRM